MTTSTADEIRARYVNLMGPELGRLFHELFEEVADVHGKWIEFLKLFGQGNDRIDLMNKTAPHFLGLVERMMERDIFLQIARLTDDAKGKRVAGYNLTVQTLSHLVPDRMRRDVKAAMKKTLSSCEWVRTRRDRTLAHSDLLTLRNEHPVPLPSVTKQHVDNALSSLADLLNMIERHFEPDASVAYSAPIDPLGGADMLIYHLRQGKAHQEQLLP